MYIVGSLVERLSMGIALSSCGLLIMLGRDLANGWPRFSPIERDDAMPPCAGILAMRSTCMRNSSAREWSGADGCSTETSDTLRFPMVAWTILLPASHGRPPLPARERRMRPNELGDLLRWAFINATPPFRYKGSATPWQEEVSVFFARKPHTNHLILSFALCLSRRLALKRVLVSKRWLVSNVCHLTP